MTWLRFLAAAIGLVSGAVFLLSALRALGELIHEWAGGRELQAAPPAEHPYEPNGGLRGAAPTFPATVLYAPAHSAAPRINGTLPGRRKDNTDDRSNTDSAPLPN